MLFSSHFLENARISQEANSKTFCIAVEVQEEGMSGVQFFFTLLFSILGLGVLVVVGLIVYDRWKQNRRKRFY